MGTLQSTGIVSWLTPTEWVGKSLTDVACAAVDFVEVMCSENIYEARHWNREKATRYVFGFQKAVVEASFFAHYKDDVHVKDVIELPTSFGCPVGCRHCASSLLPAVKQLNLSQLATMTKWIVDDRSVGSNDRFLVTFSGIGEGVFQWENLYSICRLIHAAFKNSYFTLTTVGFDRRFLYSVDELALEIPVHYLQISYLHHDTAQLRKVIPRAHVLGFDFQRLVRTIWELRNVCVRLNYVVIKGFNDGPEDVSAVLNMLDGLQSRVVLRVSALNETEPSRRYGLLPTSVSILRDIVQMFLDAGFEAYVFAAARNDNMNCGQLAWRYWVRENHE